MEIVKNFLGVYLIISIHLLLKVILKKRKELEDFEITNYFLFLQKYNQHFEIHQQSADQNQLCQNHF